MEVIRRRSWFVAKVGMRVAIPMEVEMSEGAEADITVRPWRVVPAEDLEERQF